MCWTVTEQTKTCSVCTIQAVIFFLPIFYSQFFWVNGANLMHTWLSHMPNMILGSIRGGADYLHSSTFGVQKFIFTKISACYGSLMFVGQTTSWRNLLYHEAVEILPGTWRATGISTNARQEKSTCNEHERWAEVIHPDSTKIRAQKVAGAVDLKSSTIEHPHLAPQQKRIIDNSSWYLFVCLRLWTNNVQRCKTKFIGK